MSRLLVYFYLSMATLFWGGTFVSGRLIAVEMDVYVAAFLRFFFASAFLLPILYFREGGFPRLTIRQFIAVLLLGLSGVFAYNIFFFSGLQTVEGSRASLIVAINPVLIALLSWLFFKEALNLSKGIGIFLSVFGAMLVIAKGDVINLLSGTVGVGELFLLAGVISWVVYTLVGKRVLHGMSPLAAVTYACFIGGMALLIPAVQQPSFFNMAEISLGAWLNLFYLAFFGTVVAFVWFYHGVKEIGAVKAGQFINIVPVSGVFLSAVFLKEPLTMSLLLGGALVLTGLWLTNRD